MMPRTWFTSFCLATLLFLTSCAAAPPSEFDQAQQESTQSGAAAVADTAVSGGDLNGYFPQPAADYDVVYSQEKTGLAQAKLKQAGTEVALLSIADIRNNPTAAQKYTDSAETLAGYPLAAQGSTGTGVLVADRFQVKVQSKAESFTEGDRQAWLEKFDLDGLAALDAP
jgi:hypothetical protein